MKNFKVLTIAAMLASTLFTFTSCGDSPAETTTDKTKEEKKEAVIEPIYSGFGYVIQLMEAIESGEIEIDKANSTDLSKHFDIEDKDSEYIYGNKNFDDYRINRNFNLYNGALHHISYDTFYDDERKKEAKADSQEILEYLKEKLGAPTSETETHHNWEKSSYDIKFNIFEDGYSFSINSHIVKS